MPQDVGAHAAAQLIALSVPFGQEFLVFGGALASLLFFLLYLCSLGLQFSLGVFQRLSATVEEKVGASDDQDEQDEEDAKT